MLAVFDALAFLLDCEKRCMFGFVGLCKKQVTCLCILADLPQVEFMVACNQARGRRICAVMGCFFTWNYFCDKRYVQHRRCWIRGAGHLSSVKLHSGCHRQPADLEILSLHLLFGLLRNVIVLIV